MAGAQRQVDDRFAILPPSGRLVVVDVVVVDVLLVGDVEGDFRLFVALVGEMAGEEDVDVDADVDGRGGVAVDVVGGVEVSISVNSIAVVSNAYT